MDETTTGNLSRRRVQSACIGLFALLPGLVLAGPLEEAKSHFLAGVVQVEKHDFESARKEFERSYQLNPVPDVLINIAMSQRALGKFSDAIETLDRYFAEAAARPSAANGANAARRVELTKLELEMKEKLATLQIAARAGVTFRVDGKPAGSGPMVAVKLDPGPHIVEAAAPGFETERRDLSLTTGSSASITIELKSKAPPQAIEIAKPTPTIQAVSPERNEPPRVLALSPGPAPFLKTAHGRATIGLVATTLAVFAASAVTGGLSVSTHSDYHKSCDTTCNDSLYVEAHGLALSTDVLLGVGGAAAATTLILALTRPKHRVFSAAPSAGTHNVGFVLGGKF